MNGKGWVVALSAVPTYTVVNATLTLQVVALATMALLITLASVSCWTVFGSLLRQYLRTDRHRCWFNYSMAALLVASIVPVFWE